LAIAQLSFAQKTRQQLEREKAENEEKMREVRGILNETATQKRATMGQLKAINQQISTQNRKIDLLSDDLHLMDNELSELEGAKVALDKDLQKLKEEYSSMIYAASKRNNSLTHLSFLFSASNFNQFLIRYKYLKQYTSERQKRVTQMQEVQSMMMAKTKSISNKKKDQQTVIKERVSETKNLETLKIKQSEVAKELASREAELRKEFTDLRRENQQVEASIYKLIQREIKERRERIARERAEREKIERERIAREKVEAKANEKAKLENRPVEIAKVEPKPEPKKEPENTEGMTVEEFALASSFAASKGQLNWPVRSGFVSDHFGIKKNELNLDSDNQGVTIQTKAGEGIRSVYDGVVMAVDYYALKRNVVAIQHGDFYTIYTHLKSVSVKLGQKIKAKDPIGIVATTKDGVSEVNFQIWKIGKGNNTDKLNPSVWLAPK
jgi:murein hydrolase activator